MKTLQIHELAADKELDKEAMAEIRGGNLDGLLGQIDVLSPDFFNQVTPIAGGASVPTGQINNLGQSDLTFATNGYGINYVSNNKFADQASLNDIAGLLNPFVG